MFKKKYKIIIELYENEEIKRVCRYTNKSFRTKRSAYKVIQEAANNTVKTANEADSDIKFKIIEIKGIKEIAIVEKNTFNSVARMYIDFI